MFYNPYTQAEFLKSAERVNQLPQDTGFEVAFAGRSNAGKSSALNCLTQKKQLARASKTPGRTQLINLFSLPYEDKRLVDLPGYGYAKVSQSMKDNWQRHLAHYLKVRQCLKGLILLMDIRHPNKPSDETLIQWAISDELPIHILLTKSDKLGTGRAKQQLLSMQNTYQAFDRLISIQTFSALKSAGIESLIKVLNKWLEIDESK